MFKCHLHTVYIQCITFIHIKDCKGAPEPQHNLHLKNVVDGDADDEEEHRATEEGSNRNKEIGICRCGNDTRRTSLVHLYLESFTGSEVLFKIFALFQLSRARMVQWFELTGYVVVAVLPDGFKVK